MLAKVIFFIAVAAAVLVVILLATVSPLPSKPWRDRDQLSALSLSLYVSRTTQFSFSYPILTDPDLQQQEGACRQIAQRSSSVVISRRALRAYRVLSEEFGGSSSSRTARHSRLLISYTWSWTYHRSVVEVSAWRPTRVPERG
uniref:Uncharacterized protein n=1 Tax=Ananas comosus var. bracteatus TaxID=296719 RepID=A0A6V7NV72_ANACO|nr:unnamed protein product [Ananas comosus var. bracteatus]